MLTYTVRRITAALRFAESFELHRTALPAKQEVAIALFCNLVCREHQ